MKSVLILSLIFFSSHLQAQYYYKDVISNKESNELIKLYTNNKVQMVSIKSFEADGLASEGFFGQQLIMASEHIIRTTTRSGMTDESVLISAYDDEGRITQIKDSAGSISSITIYSYDKEGRLASVKTTSTDTSKSVNETEEHNWYYNAAGKPERMQRIINKNEPVEIKFRLDENGNVIEEQTYKKGMAGDIVYYYYDNKNRLTDIVRYNNKAKRLLPDYMFEYSDAGQVIQKITIPGSGSDYLIWRYQYDSKGLKIREALFDRQKKLTGKIEYNYIFSP